jgi:formate/nitrite transporter FocA (FNT family)
MKHNQLSAHFSPWYMHLNKSGGAMQNRQHKKQGQKELMCTNMKHPRTDVADGISCNLIVCYFVYLKCKVRDYKTSIAPPLLLRCMYPYYRMVREHGACHK